MKYIASLVIVIPNSTKNYRFAPKFQSREEAEERALIIVGHEIFTDASEGAIIMANNIVCKEVVLILRLSHKISFY